MLRTISTRALALFAVIAFAGCAEVAPPPAGCNLDLVQQIDVDRALAHLRVLSVEIGPRVASSPGERAAAEYLAAELENLGYEVEIQEFARTGLSARFEVHQPAGLAIHPAYGRIRETPTADYPLLTPEDGITARIVDCGAGACPDEVAGHIALLAPGDNGDAEARIAAAAAQGAVAGIVHGPTWRRFTVTVEEAEIPFVSVNLDAAEAIRLAGEVDVTLHVGRYDTSQNVIATRPVEGDPEAPVVVFSAHYDSVEQSPGANDNGSGTVGMLELARILANVETAVELRFAAVGAEEVGLVGARHYVSELPDSERARIVANFNTDMIGTAGEDQVQLFVNTLDGDNLVAQSARAAREKLGYPEEMLRAPYQRGASDHVAFHDAGIPAANFIWRDPETIALEPWYHHPHDRIENVSEERLRTALEIVLAASLEVICEGPQTGG